MTSHGSSQDGTETDDMKPILYDLTKMKSGKWQGLEVPYIEEEPDVHFEKVLNMQLRDDDVLLCTYPNRSIVSTMRIPPRVLATHMPFKFLPRQVKDRHTRVVHVYRNPKAVFVSLHLMLKNIGNSRDVSWDGRVERFLHGTDNEWKWTSYMDNVIDFEKNNPRVPIHHVAYEDLKLCPVDTIQKLASFLNVPATEELCQQIAKAVTFDRQKEEESRRMHKSGLGVNIYRRGEIDDWKNHLTVALSEQIDQALKERAQRCPFSARYLQPLQPSQ